MIIFNNCIDTNRSPIDEMKFKESILLELRKIDYW